MAKIESTTPFSAIIIESENYHHDGITIRQWMATTIFNKIIENKPIQLMEQNKLEFINTAIDLTDSLIERLNQSENYSKPLLKNKSNDG